MVDNINLNQLNRGLTGLPEELLTNIGHRIGSDDIFALRLCNKAVEHKIFHDFGTRFFAAKCVHFTTDSLKVLVDISKSRLADYVKSISVMTALFSERAFECPGHTCSHWHPTVRQSEAYKFYIDDQLSLKGTQMDMCMLSDAFKALESLSSVAIIDDPAFKGVEVDYRGYWKVLRSTGTCPIDGTAASDRHQSTPEYRQWIAHVWLVVLGALASGNGRIKPDQFRLGMTLPNNSISAKQMSLPNIVTNPLANAFASTTKVLLNLRGYNALTDARKHGEAVAKFGGLFTSVKCLQLVFDDTESAGYLFNKLMSKIKCSDLQLFETNGLRIDARSFAKLIARLKKVESLLLTGVDLSSGEWPLVLQEMAKLESLDHLHLRYLKQAGVKAYFLSELTEEEWVAREAGEQSALFGGVQDDDAAYVDVDDDEDSASDDDLPDLEPVNSDDPHATSDTTVSSPLNSKSPTSELKDDAPAPADVMPDYVPEKYSVLDYGDRGFFICVKSPARIQRELPIFISSYHTGDAAHPYLAGLPTGGIPIALGGGAHMALAPGLAAGGLPPAGFPFGGPGPPGGAGGHGAAGGGGNFAGLMSAIFGGPPPGAGGPSPFAAPPGTAQMPAQPAGGAASPAATAFTPTAPPTTTAPAASAGAEDGDAFTDGEESEEGE